MQVNSPSSVVEQPSFYYEIQTQYKRSDTQVIEATGHPSEKVWRFAELSLLLVLNKPARRKFVPIRNATGKTTGVEEFTLHTAFAAPINRYLLVWEKRYDNHYAGVVFLADEWQSREYFAFALLRQKWSASCPVTPLLAQIDSNEEATICDLFERTLLYRTPDTDMWATRGKSQFLHGLSYFVQRRQPVLFCLPAFPCKSTNPEKTASTMPDGAEYEALTTLKSFCNNLKALYPPGCYLDIVSDGHVFSDCIGIDDDDVTRYTAALQTMAEQVFRRHARCGSGTCVESLPVRFHNLRTLLYPRGSRWQSVEAFPKVFHPVSTVINELDDNCRTILLGTCRTSSSDLQYIVKTMPDHALTTLYRGFSRFMCEDLRALPGLQGMSAKKRSRLASSVGLEMIQRNQAYSHLVELAMPQHVRLSIHAHNNMGPKFAICLLPPDQFQTLTTFEHCRLASRSGGVGTDSVAWQAKNHLHIPTPWHGVLVEVSNSTKVYVCKARVVEAELRREGSPWHFESGYVADHPRGGRFVLVAKD